MKAEILGKKHSCIEENGRVKHYYKLFLVHKNPFDNEFTKYEGMGCSDVSVPESVFNTAIVGRECELDFDSNRKLLEFNLIE